MRTLALLLACTAAAVSEESSPVSVAGIRDGRTILVTTTLGGLEMTVPVGLRYVRLADGDDGGAEGASYRFLAGALPVGTLVVLIASPPLTVDPRRQAVEAVICVDRETSAEERAAQPEIRGHRTCIQIDLVRAGAASYWEKDGEAPEELQRGMLDAEREARERAETEKPAESGAAP